MSQSRVDPTDPRNTPFGRVTGVIYWFLVIELCFLLAARGPRRRVVVVAIIAFGSDWVAALAGSLLAAFLLMITKPIIDDCRERFVEPEPA
ncbi:hypothetical protein GCM10028820_03880 [Tessaracoccus terricola]